MLKSRYFKSLLQISNVILLLCGLTACTTVQNMQTAEHNDKQNVSFPPLRQLEPLSLDKKTWNEITTAVELYYTTRISVQTLSEGALRSLQLLEPSLWWIIKGQQISSYFQNHLLLQVDIPDENNTRGWRTFVFETVAKARKFSVALRRTHTERLEELIFTGLVSKLDENSRYIRSIDEHQRRKYMSEATIGLVLKTGRTSWPEISYVEDSSPAAAAGLKAGMLVTSVNGTPTSGKLTKEVETLLKGEAGTRLKIKIVHKMGEAPKFYQIKRAEPDTGSVHILASPTGSKWPIVKIQYFESATDSALLAALSKLRREIWRQRHHGIVLDLRGNLGGDIHSAIDAADIFLREGTISRSVGRHPSSFQIHRATPNPKRSQTLFESHSVALVALVDKDTASSAEVFISALRDNGRAVIVGERTHGKGNVQTVVPLSNGGTLNLTWASLIAPAGYSFHTSGIAPTLCPFSNLSLMEQPIQPKTLHTHLQDLHIQLKKKPLERRHELCEQFYGPGQVLFHLSDLLISKTSLYNQALTLQRKGILLELEHKRQKRGL